MTVFEVLDEVEKDKPFYKNSNGGLTVSGGEPLMQSEFTLALLKQAKADGVNTAIETSCFGDTQRLIEIAKYVDYFYTDIKTIDDEIHIQNTGVSNKLILNNITAVRENYPNLYMCIRTPVIPEVNDDTASISAIRDFKNTLGECTDYELLKYHRLGEPKYQSLHRDYPMGEVQLDDELFLGLVEVANL